jgi:trehalose 6-phosphate synthase/phosphatase
MSNLHEPRVVLVSNRLPVSVTLTAEGVNVRPSSGGLASGLRSVHAGGQSAWIGWPGIDVPVEEDRLRVGAALAEHRVVPVHFSAEETEHFYEGVANGVIWPLFHYLLDRVPASILHWEDYVRANERFADAVAAEARATDLIWIHDYHLLLLPGMLRERLPDARIGFFLHIPFPSSEVFRVLPHRESVLGGLLGADLIGFHTFNDQRHFSAALLSVLGLETEVDRIEVAGRSAQLRVLPMGADVRGFTDLASQAAVGEQSRKLRAAHEADKLVLGVDRLDYTKGLSHKFLAVERLLERNPQYRGKFRLLQVAVPSRENVSAYRELKREIEEIAGRINGAYGTLHSAPIHYVYDSVNETELAGSYRAADVMLVTPLRDGMNLVAKEYVASRVDGDGVLVLSEFAGAASELADALIANPYDVSAIAAALDRALTMPQAERRAHGGAARARARPSGRGLGRLVRYGAARRRTAGDIRRSARTDRRAARARRATRGGSARAVCARLRRYLGADPAVARGRHARPGAVLFTDGSGGVPRRRRRGGQRSYAELALGLPRAFADRARRRARCLVALAGRGLDLQRRSLRLLLEGAGARDVARVRGADARSADRREDRGHGVSLS